MREFKQSAFSKALNIILPLAIIIVMIIMITQVSTHVEKLRGNRATDFMNIMQISILSSCDGSGVDIRCQRTLAIMSYINSIDNKYVVFFDDNLELIYPPYKHEVILDLKEDLVDICAYMNTNSSGRISELVDGTQKDIYFEWIYTNNGSRYLLIYVTNQYILDFTYLYIFSYIIITLVLIFAIKTNFVDHMIYMKILSKANKSAIDNFKYRKYDS